MVLQRLEPRAHLRVKSIPTCVFLMGEYREEHPDLMESMTKKGSNVPEKPKTPQQLWYNHEKKAFLKTRPDVSEATATQETKKLLFNHS